MRVDGVWAQPAILFVAVFVALIRAPMALYLHVAHPDWSWLYLLDSRKVPGLLVVSVVAACAGATLGGYYGGVRLVRLGKERILLGVVAGLGLAVFLTILLLGGRLARYGSYAQFHAHRTLPLFDVKLGWVLLLLLIGLAVGTVLTSLELLRDGRRAAAR